MLDNERCLSKKTSICSEAIIICTDISIVLCTKDSALKTFEISAILLNCLDQKPLHKPNYDKIWTNLNFTGWTLNPCKPNKPRNLFIGPEIQKNTLKFEPFLTRSGLSTKIEPEGFQSSEVGFDSKYIKWLF